MKKLVLEELTLEQKIGQLLMVRGFINEEDRAFVYEMMEKRCVGAIQIPPTLMDYKKEIAEVKKHTDYPILIFADMESGLPTGEHTIPSAMALSITADEELAYQFGAVTGKDARKYGYTLVGGPVVDLIQGDNMIMVPRCFGEDPEYVSRMTTAVLKGENESGVIGIMKHWPTAPDVYRDGHVYDDRSAYTEEDIMNSVIKPYLYAMEKGELGAVMSTHSYYPNIDPEYPASLSEKIIGILRKQGYDGLMITDSFAMLSILQNFGEEQCYGMSVKAGHDLILPNYRKTFKEAYDLLMSAYQKGIFTEEQLNNAVRRVLKAQNDTVEPKGTVELSAYQEECIRRIATDSITLIKDENVPTALDPDKKKMFVLLKENDYKDDDGVPYEITVKGGITDKNIKRIKELILEKFPGSLIKVANQYPCAPQIEAICCEAIDVDEIIFLTYATSNCYVLGGDFTPRVVHMMEAIENKLAAVIHMGNPYPLEAVPHFPRVLITVGAKNDCMERELSALKGEWEPQGKLPLELKLK